MPRVRQCFEAGAIATGCTVELKGGDRSYADMIHDVELGALYQLNAQTLGRKFHDSIASQFSASTDMANVSHRVPAIHPIIGINSLPASNHQPEFAAHCVTEDADQAIFDGALALAWAAIDAAVDPAMRHRLTSKGR